MTPTRQIALELVLLVRERLDPGNEAPHRPAAAGKPFLIALMSEFDTFVIDSR